MALGDMSLSTREWLELFPEPYKSKILAAQALTRPGVDLDRAKTGLSEVLGIIIWSRSAEGNDYWYYMERMLIIAGIAALSRESVQEVLSKLDRSKEAVCPEP